MYDELIEALRNCTNPNKYCEDCGFFDKCCLSKEHFSIEEQAADAIEELQKKYDETQDALITADLTRVYLEDVLKYIKTLAENYKAHNRWIPVTERLPEEYKDVLCYYEYFRYGDYNCMFRTIDRGYYGDGRWGGEAGQGHKNKVLAWMPLPQPPKEE